MFGEPGSGIGRAESIRRSLMSVRMRVTIKAQGDRASELTTATDARRDLWAQSPVEIDPDHPLRGTHRDEDGRAYFELATEFPREVHRVIEEHKYTGKVELTETPALPGEACANCGNVTSPVRPTVCPNCQFRDITPCRLVAVHRCCVFSTKDVA